MPLTELLERHGVGVLQEPAQLAQRLGLRVAESQGIVVKTVLRGSAAEQAGFCAGDEWLGLEPATKVKSGLATAAGWRLNKLDDLLLYAGKQTKMLALVARDKRLLRLNLSLPPPESTWRLAAKDASLLDAWLNPAA